MKQIHLAVSSILLLCCSLFSQAQQTVATNTNTVVPSLVNFSGTLTDDDGKPLTGITGVTFYLYQEQQGGAPVWMETQNVQPNPNGQYTVMLGATSSTGLPATIFQSGEAHWLGVQAQGQAEQPRVMLLSVPYALKAGDAQTVGGLPPSAFVLAAPASTSSAPSDNTAAAGVSSSTTLPLSSSDVTTTGGTANALPLFTTTTNIQNSIITQTGKTGVNVAGKLNLPATGTATSTAGKNSQPQTFVASAFNSGTSTAVAQTFQWQAEPVGNDTSTASGSLNLLFGQGTSKPTETGLNIASNGIITFNSGQTFPGAGTGTVTSVASGAGLMGGPITSSGTLSIATAGVTNAMLANSSLTVTAGTALTGGGAVSLGGSTTLNVDTTKVPLLNTNNTFTGTQVMSGTNSAGVLQVTNTLTSGQTYGVLGRTSSPNGSGVLGEGPTTGGFGVTGQTSGGTAVYGLEAALSGSSIGVWGLSQSTSGVGVFGEANAGSGTATGVAGQTSSPSGYGVEGTGPNVGVYGTAGAASGATSGVYGTASSSSSFGVQGMSPNVGVYGQGTGSSGIGVDGHGTIQGVKGISTATNGVAQGVYGLTSSSSGFGAEGVSPNVGVYGQASGGSSLGSLVGGGFGVWGDTGGTSQLYVGVAGTADDNVGGWFINDTSTDTVTPALEAVNNSTDSSSLVFQTESGVNNAACTINANADLSCSGTVGGAVRAGDGARKVMVHAVQSPENWFEDFGSGTLANGSATVALDPTFASTVNTTTDYHVFLTAKGDCKGLYVTNETATGFEVRELGTGNSNVAFDYRIVAKRAGYENQRLEDVTERYQQMQEQQRLRRERMQQRRAARPASALTAAPEARAIAAPPAPATSAIGPTPPHR